MFLFLIPLLIGFACHLASAFTAEWSRRWGAQVGTRVTIVLRDVLGLPVWAAGFALAAAAPAARLLPQAAGLALAGWVLAGAGGLVILAALSSLRARAAAPSVNDTLVERGLYAHLRHPIHAGALLEFTGLALILPTLSMAVACALGVGWLVLQTRCEERDLLQRLPAYREYRQRVPAFLPRLKGKSP